MIDVVAVALIDPGGRILLQQRRADRQHGGLWEFPGGKVEPRETAVAGLIREIEEELGTTVSAIEHFGRYEDEAAGDSRRVSISLYTGVLAAEPVASGEIAELIWFGADDDTALISPSLRRQILPDLLRRGILR